MGPRTPCSNISCAGCTPQAQNPAILPEPLGHFKPKPLGLKALNLELPKYLVSAVVPQPPSPPWAAGQGVPEADTAGARVRKKQRGIAGIWRFPHKFRDRLGGIIMDWGLDIEVPLSMGHAIS